ncbi:MAG: 50S ribosomal protein L29 [Puniceicoccales bacterium]|jgi:ribosomal protein L29|nr:50S ribosomal protein L29 [Puniceicoccales bacterium]MDR1232793.1 50S ribosomal protein L29 [Puniceicoccales bacterium]
MKNKDFINLTYQEICQKEMELRDELIRLKLKRKIGQLEKTHRFSEIRRNIARLMGLKSRQSKD